MKNKFYFSNFSRNTPFTKDISHANIHTDIVSVSNTASNSKPLIESNNNNKKLISNFVANLLDTFNTINKDLINNEETQRRIESIIIDEFDLFFSGNKTRYIGGVNVELLGPSLTKYIQSKQDEIKLYIDKLKLSDIAHNKNKTENIFIKEIISKLDNDFLFNLCLLHFLLIYTYQNSDNEKNHILLPVSITIGKKMIRKYFDILKIQGSNGAKLESHSIWIEKWSKDNPNFSEIIDDSLHSLLGCKLLEILEHSDMIKKVLIKSFKSSLYILNIVEHNLLQNKKHRIINLPTKLPMICEPKAYTKDSLGGYLLNDVNFTERLFIEKKGYGVNTELEDNHKIYDMVNNISKTPFKINVELLDYITTNGLKHNLLMDIDVEHKYASLEKRTTYQEREYSSYNSKLILQETILGIASFLTKFEKIYFPVRLDQRGRLYCSPNFFNYQSNELSKALILFSEPGIIGKDNMEAISYLKAYGVNSFGGKASKMSNNAKLEWVDKNIDNILNYDNGILLSKAKDKLLFLTFCMEYKRFYEFYTNENAMKFYTYLPIQLDATCNGFQHMALLSNEDTLFKELNLVSKANKSNKDINSIEPSDFYNFLLHKLTNLFEDMITKGITNDTKTSGSYERLSKFLWDRSFLKKAIMTIPYNSSDRAMRKYICDSLVRVDIEDKDFSWYSDNSKNSKTIINNKDIALLVNCLSYIIGNDFEKIKKLSKYLKNIAGLYNILELPIIWTLPTGLIIKQSYLETKSTSITPFMYSKTKLNLRVTIKDKFDKNKQVRALMPNLIHSLDGSSLSLLYNQFSTSYNDLPQFYSVHDCFGTTIDKVFRLKTILASVYTDLYSSEPYLYKFDNSILDSIEKYTNYKLDKNTRTLELPNSKYVIHDIEWVMNKKELSKKSIKSIDSQHILI